MSIKQIDTDAQYCKTDVAAYVMLVARRLAADAQKRLGEHNLSLAQFQALQILWQEDGVTMSRMAERLCCHDSNITHLIRRMERDGLIVRMPDAADQRISRIHLTATTRTLEREFEGIGCCGIALPQLTPDEQQTLVALLTKLIRPTERSMQMEETKTTVRERYATAAKNAIETGSPGCCGAGQATTKCDCDPISAGNYARADLDLIPPEASAASLGCGNPTALAELREGETVLDLGSGGGIDVLLSARRVGPTGFAYGLDMTDEMLQLAEQNLAKSGVTNARFLKGDIENIPLPDASVDVVISNCVINLSTNKDRVLTEAFRVLRPGGRFAVSDIVTNGDLPPAVKSDLMAWAGCVAGALSVKDYTDKLARAGFANIEIKPTRIFSAKDICDTGCFETIAKLPDDERANLDGKLWSAFIRATRPS